MKAVQLTRKYKTLLHKNGITSNLRLAHFWAQLHHESNLKPISENLNYSQNALIRVFKKYFPTTYAASRYARKPKEIANKVYANRMGNGDQSSGDGWRYRGRGFIQLTGKNNYRALSQATGVDYLSNPDWLLKEPDAMIAALWFWNTERLNKYADADNLEQLTRRINGGYNGLQHRKELTDYYKKVFI